MVLTFLFHGIVFHKFHNFNDDQRNCNVSEVKLKNGQSQHMDIDVVGLQNDHTITFLAFC